jgi:hypothetical protein
VLSVRRATWSTRRPRRVQALRAGGVGISLRDADLKILGRNLSVIASHAEVRFPATTSAEQARTYASAKQASLRMVGRPVATWTTSTPAPRSAWTPSSASCT